MQKALSVEDAEKMMDEAAEGLAYCNEIGLILSEQLSDYDNKQVLEDLAMLEEVHCTTALWQTATYKLLYGRNGGELLQQCQLRQLNSQICQMLQCQSKQQQQVLHQPATCKTVLNSSYISTLISVVMNMFRSYRSPCSVVTEDLKPILA